MDYSDSGVCVCVLVNESLPIELCMNCAIIVSGLFTLSAGTAVNPFVHY